MQYYFFHHGIPISRKSETFRQIWFPLNDDINTVLKYIRNHHKEAVHFLMENSFQPYIKTITDVQFFEPLQLEEKPVKKILFFAQSDTLAHSCWLMGERLKNQLQVLYTVPKLKKERSDVFFSQKGIPYTEFSAKTLRTFRPDAVVLLNDWSKQPQWLISLCRLHKIPVICMQESVIDFGDRFKRMQWADEVMIQGTQTLFDLKREVYYLTGNPRYESLSLLHSNERDSILINSNFTYGIFEEVRNSWIHDIAECAEKLETPYFISQHPRDKGDISAYRQVIRSSSMQVADQLTKARCVVTRFSSLIHEALVAGIPVVYYNPHGEKMQYDFGFNHEFLLLATNKHELEIALRKVISFSNREKIQDYLVNHCIQKENKPLENILQLFTHLKFKSQAFSIKDAWKLIIYHPSLLRLIWFIKQR